MTKKLYKSATNKMVDGVCSGIAQYFNLDPTLIRLIWAIFLFTGTGILAYIVCAVIIPREPMGEAAYSGDTSGVKEPPQSDNPYDTRGPGVN